MDAVKFKYETVADMLEKMIASGDFPTGKLPSEPEIMANFKVGKITVYKALEKLAKQGLIERIQGKGTFIVDRCFGSGPDFVLSRSVAVMMRSTGHYFGEFFNAIKQALFRENHFALICSAEDWQLNDLTHRTHIDSLLNSGLKGALVYGGAYWRSPVIHNYTKVKTVFLDYYDYDGIPPHEMAVLVDYESGIYQATKHLLDIGRKNIVLLRNQWPTGVEFSESHRLNHPIFCKEQGFTRAMKEYGRDGEILPLSVEKVSRDFQIRSLLPGGDSQPDAVICPEDSVAVKLLQTAMSKGIKVPDDLAIIGFYDTPWCTESPIPITSVNTNLEKIANKAVTMLLHSEKEKSGIVNVEPTLVIRESTGGNSTIERETKTNELILDAI